MKKEKKISKEKVDSYITKIRAEGKAREKKYQEKYISGMKNREQLLSQSEKKTITNRKDLQEYKNKLYEQSNFNPAREKFKSKIAVGASKVDTRISVGLERAYQGARKLASQKVVSRGVLKKNSMVVNVPNYKAPSVLGDENRFFKGEMDKEKRSLFFS
jgi:hypothetical protein